MNPAIIDENEAAIRLSLLNAIAVLLDTPAAEPGLGTALLNAHDAVCICPFDGTDPGCNMPGGVQLGVIRARLRVPAPEEEK